MQGIVNTTLVTSATQHTTSLVLPRPFTTPNTAPTTTANTFDFVSAPVVASAATPVTFSPAVAPGISSLAQRTASHSFYVNAGPEVVPRLKPDFKQLSANGTTQKYVAYANNNSETGLALYLFGIRRDGIKPFAGEFGCASW